MLTSERSINGRPKASSFAGTCLGLAVMSASGEQNGDSAGLDGCRRFETKVCDGADDWFRKPEFRKHGKFGQFFRLFGSHVGLGYQRGSFLPLRLGGVRLGPSATRSIGIKLDLRTVRG